VVSTSRLDPYLLIFHPKTIDLISNDPCFAETSVFLLCRPCQTSRTTSDTFCGRLKVNARDNYTFRSVAVPYTFVCYCRSFPSLDMHSFVSFASIFFFLLSANAASSSCKVVPSSPQWPDANAWAGLNATITGRLMKPLPLAASCHRDQPNYDTGACEEVRDRFKIGSFHTDHPTSSMWQNYNNYSCMPDAAAPCSNNGYPVYVVAAKSAKDVQAAVNFARTNKIRLNIKSTG
jgi:hypothetical protein